MALRDGTWDSWQVQPGALCLYPIESSQLVWTLAAMGLRVQFGNARKLTNAYHIEQGRDHFILQVAAFGESPLVEVSFYKSILEHFRSVIPVMWLQIQSRASLGGGRMEDVSFAPSAQVASSDKYLVYDLPGKKELGAAFDAFWMRKPIRFYGWNDVPFTKKLDKLHALYPNDDLKQYASFIPKLLRVCAEKDMWGGFLSVVGAKDDLDVANNALKEAGTILSKPLVMTKCFR